MALIFGHNTPNKFLAPLDFSVNGDIVFSGNGNDTIEASISTNDTVIFSGNGNDTISAGTQTVAFAEAGNDTLISSADGNTQLYGGVGNDTFFLGNNDFAVGGSGDDALFVTGGDSNLLLGGNGIDQFWVVNGNPPTAPLTDLNTIADYSTTDTSLSFPLPIVGDVIGIGAAGLTVADVTVTQDSTISADTIISVTGIDVARVKNVVPTDLSIVNGADVGFNDSILIIAAAQPPAVV